MKKKISKFDNKKPNNVNISGRNIYHDEQNRTIYLDPLTKKGYVIEESEQRKFYMYQNRFIIVMLTLILSADLISNWLYTIGLGLVFLISFELVFRLKYLPKLTVAEGFKPVYHATTMNEIIRQKDKKKIILKVFLYAALSVLIIYNAYKEDLTLTIKLLSMAISIISGYLCILNIIGFIKSKE